ncbi:MAG TPA: ATP-dependent helicase [bacterium]|nr:ATP-dependent helicase [bacterium]
MIRRYVPLDEDFSPETPPRKKSKHAELPAEYEADLAVDFESAFIAPAERRHTPATPRRYATPPMPPDTEERIRRLQELAASIGTRILTDADAPAADTEIMRRYRDLLNPSQFLAATYSGGPVLVIAGAGSGKTRTLVHRTAWLIENGVEPESILLLTFTRKAAQEMSRRAVSLVGRGEGSRITAGTFHSFASFLLRRYGTLTGAPPAFTIADQSDAEDIVDLIRRELKLDKKDRKFPRKGPISETLSRSRNLDLPLAETIDRFSPALREFTGDIALIAEMYAKFKTAHRILDYDDLLDYLYRALQEQPEFLAMVQDRWRHIMVDEFQDTNIVQKRIVDLIASRDRNIMVVGDDAQSIYAFRGANFENILRFPETYPDCRIIRLERNYRSTQEILDLANAVIDGALIGYPKRLYSDDTAPGRPLIKTFADQESEAGFIVSEIVALSSQVPLSDIAVLYRASFHGNFIQAELMRRGIPFVVYGGLKFVERRHIKDILSYLRIVVNRFDAVAWNRVLTLLPGIGGMTAGQVIACVMEHEGRLEFKQFKGRKFHPYLETLATVLETARDSRLSPLQQLEVVKSHYLPLLKEIEADWEERLRDIEVLEQIAGGYEELEKFLADFALEPPSRRLSTNDRPPDENEEEPLVLSTVHSAKGLEWHTVFVPHLLDGLFPADRSLKRIEDIEEERRLFYVACSRAKRRLYLTLPAQIAFWGGVLHLPSRFIADLRDDLYES